MTERLYREIFGRPSRVAAMRWSQNGIEAHPRLARRPRLLRSVLSALSVRVLYLGPSSSRSVPALSRLDRTESRPDSASAARLFSSLPLSTAFSFSCIPESSLALVDPATPIRAGQKMEGRLGVELQVGQVRLAQDLKSLNTSAHTHTRAHTCTLFLVSSGEAWMMRNDHVRRRRRSTGVGSSCLH